MPKTKTKRQFSDIFAKYKHYDPKAEGYGTPESWTGAFRATMGFEEAERVVYGAQDSPRGILGLLAGCSWEEIRSAFRKLSMATHPDRAIVNQMTVDEATEAFKRILAAYTVLQREFGKD